MPRRKACGGTSVPLFAAGAQEANARRLLKSVYIPGCVGWCFADNPGVQGVAAVLGSATKGVPSLGCGALAKWGKVRDEARFQVRDSENPDRLPKDENLLSRVYHALHVASACCVHTNLDHGFVAPGVRAIGLHWFSHVHGGPQVLLEG